jgi:hypothetical protein
MREDSESTGANGGDRNVASDAKIIHLWKRPDGTTCLVSRRENVLYISVERDGIVLQRRSVDSPVEAMIIAKKWETSLNDS